MGRFAVANQVANANPLAFAWLCVLVFELQLTKALQQCIICIMNQERKYNPLPDLSGRVTPYQFAELIGAKPRTIYAWIKRGRLEHIEFDGRLYLKAINAERIIEIERLEKLLSE